VDEEYLALLPGYSGVRFTEIDRNFSKKDSDKGNHGGYDEREWYPVQRTASEAASTRTVYS